MKVISDEPKNRVVELDPVEIRHRNYVERLLDEGWDLHTAVKYSQRRFGPMTPAFRNWVLF